jgi:hypothetical protein
MKYFFGFLASLALIILVFVLVLRGFGGNDGGTAKSPLTDFASSDAVVRLTVAGRIISEQEHRAYQITVGRSEVRLETLKGYEYETVATKTYENNQESYYTFLRALDLAGFDRGSGEKGNDDERGVCADGHRYVYEVIQGTSEEQRLWSTSCGDGGTFKGNAAAVRQLFNKQVPVPDQSKIIGRVRL